MQPAREAGPVPLQHPLIAQPQCGYWAEILRFLSAV